MRLGLAMMSVLSHWLIAKPFVFSLYKCDTTRMVGRLFKAITIYTSLLIHIHLNIPPISPTYTYTSYSSLIPPYTYTTYSSLIPPYTYTTYSSLIPYIYLHSLHLINSPTYTYTAYISLIPHIYLHSLHLINPPHIPTQPTSHLSPTHTYTAFIVLIPNIYLHSFHDFHRIKIS